MNSTDQSSWDIGTLNKDGIWSYYVAANYLGAALCCVMLWSIYNKPDKHVKAVDIFVGGLCSGCIWMSLTCGGQCLVSVVHGYFYGGTLACQLEAFFHVSAILVQFWSVTSVATNSFLLVGYNIVVHPRTAKYVVLAIWLVCIAVTYGLSHLSPIYLMSAGTYCFFGFSSPAIVWMVASLLLALLWMTICFVCIICWVRHARQSVYRIQIHTSTPRYEEDDSTTKKVAWRAAMWVGLLLLGWICAAVTTIYEFMYGRATETLVTAVGVGGVTHSVFVSPAYAHIDDYHRRILCCHRQPSPTDPNPEPPTTTTIIVTPRPRTPRP